jgi:hypothetical protein
MRADFAYFPLDGHLGFAIFSARAADDDDGRLVSLRLGTSDLWGGKEGKGSEHCAKGGAASVQVGLRSKQFGGSTGV